MQFEIIKGNIINAATDAIVLPARKIFIRNRRLRRDRKAYCSVK